MGAHDIDLELLESNIDAIHRKKKFTTLPPPKTPFWVLQILHRALAYEASPFIRAIGMVAFAFKILFLLLQ